MSGECVARLGPEDGGICLHGLLEVAADLGHAEGPLRVPQLVQARDRVLPSVRRQLRLRLSWLALLGCARATNKINSLAPSKWHI